MARVVDGEVVYAEDTMGRVYATVHELTRVIAVVKDSGQDISLDAQYILTGFLGMSSQLDRILDILETMLVDQDRERRGGVL